MTIAIIDYGMGNLRSVEKSCAKLGMSVELTNKKAHIAQAEALILPGVGAFGAAMANLKKLDLIEPLKEKLLADTPFLGICLGLQVLFEKSEESPGIEGLGVLKGEVKHFYSQKGFPREELTIPHMGWNQVKREKELRLFAGIPPAAYFYFVHSYIVKPLEKNIGIGTSDYGQDFIAALEKGNIFATQFHPEKSSPWGLKILENFSRMVMLKKSE